MPPEFYRWLVNSPWTQLMNAYEWVFPVVQSLHFVGFAMSIGTISIVDFGLLGFGANRLKPADLAADLAPWTLAGFVVMLTTGPLMFSTDAVAYHLNPSFQFKMIFLTLALVYHYTLHRHYLRTKASPAVGKVIGAVSILLWTAVLVAGRMIAFV